VVTADRFQQLNRTASEAVALFEQAGVVREARRKVRSGERTLSGRRICAAVRASKARKGSAMTVQHPDIPPIVAGAFA
jgi:hypothetical protein